VGTTPSSSDTSQRVGHQYARERGIGLHSNFICAACRQSRITLGRKLKRVQGVKQYVCRGCQ
jgi:predicted SprT family Zn-dependent metalloprotease